jgi:hypothetical protein
MRDWVPQQGGESLMLLIRQLVLIAEENDLVPHQRRADRVKRHPVEIARQRDSADLRTDTASNWDDIERAFGILGIDEIVDQISHVMSPW